MRDKDFEEKVINYIREHERDHIDMVDLTIKFSNYGVEKIMDATRHLRTNQIIFRVPVGIHYYYTLVKPKENE